MTVKIQANPENGDAVIAARVATITREQFLARYPNQVEHIMRLIAEQLQLGLRKDSPAKLLPAEIEQLASALNHIYDIHCNLND